MQQHEFEQSISKFFEKAGVRLVKNGEGYGDSVAFPSYILLDSKRRSYYFAETDVQAVNAEIEASIVKFAEDAGLSKNSANALYKIGKDISANDNKFSLDSDDLSAFECKSSLIISEENSEEIKKYLSSNSYQFQTVPLKGQFSVIFFDKGMEEKLITLYGKYSNAESIDDDIAPVFTPKEDANIEDIDLSAPKQNNFDAETPLVEPKIENSAQITEQQAENGKTPENKENIPDEKAEEELLDNIDLSDILKPPLKEEVPEDETEAELLYGKLLNEQSDKIEVSETGPVEKSIDDLPEGLISEEDMEDMSNDTATEEVSDAADTSNTPLDKKAAKLKAKEEKKLAKLAKKLEKNAEKPEKESSYERKKRFDIPGKIAANFIGIVFFLPVYILNKLIGKFLPPFVLYWLTAIVTIFGWYKVFSLFPKPVNDVFLNEVNNTISLLQNYKVDIAEGQAVSDIITISAAMIKSSAVTYYSFLKAMDMFVYNGGFLQYMLGFGAVLMIFPACRFIGKTFTIFSLLSYFLLPCIVYSQNMLIKYSVNLAEVSLAAGAVNFIVYIYPLIMLFMILFVSSSLVPDKDIRKEVLP